MLGLPVRMSQSPGHAFCHFHAPSKPSLSCAALSSNSTLALPPQDRKRRLRETLVNAACMPVARSDVGARTNGWIVPEQTSRNCPTIFRSMPPNCEFFFRLLLWMEHDLELSVEQEARFLLRITHAFLWFEGCCVTTTFNTYQLTVSSRSWRIYRSCKLFPVDLLAIRHSTDRSSIPFQRPPTEQNQTHCCRRFQE